jgi:hypothetical protein
MEGRGWVLVGTRYTVTEARSLRCALALLASKLRMT